VASQGQPERPGPAALLPAERRESVQESSSLQLLLRVKAGDHEALALLFERLRGSLRRWAHGRLPRWARADADTSDIVQDVLIRTISRLGRFEPRQSKALQGYLREAVRNRIRDEVRKIERRPRSSLEEHELAATQSPLADAMEAENTRRYRAALAQLSDEDRDVIVARLELGYSYEQVALMTGRSSPDSARMAVRRALLRLAEEMDAR
jgi:RNA polymerase sigma factor (sigma-70 family)